MKKLRHYFPPLAALAALAATAQAQMPEVKGPDKPVPVIKLPAEPTKNVVQYNATGVREVPWHVSYVKAPEAWAINPLARGKGVRVAILDTGVQADHPGLQGSVKGTYNAITKQPGKGADGHGHGTHCAGIVHSIAPDAEIYAVKVLGDDGSGAVDVIAHGIDYAVTTIQADVISMSLGGPAADEYMPPAIARAIKAGVVVVAAAGNDGPGDTEGYPGRYAESVSVAACDKNGKLASFSSWGPNVFTADPGVDILSTLPGSKEGLMSGTSMATPCEAGKVASWIASNGVAKDATRRDKYRAAAKSVMPFKERTNAVGYGLYWINRITGTATAPPNPPGGGSGGNPPQNFVQLTWVDLTPAAQAKLNAAGIYGWNMTVGVGQGAAPKSAEMPAVQSGTVPPSAPAPLPVYQPAPVPGVWAPAAPAWYPALPQPVPMTMPAPVCGPGGCPQYQPAPQAWYPGQRIVNWIR